MKSLRYTKQFEKETSKFHAETKENIFILIQRYLSGEKPPPTQFKTFYLTKKERIQEFKVKDEKENWRVVSCILEKDTLTFIYAFHKKSQKLINRDKKTILKRIKDLRNG